MYFDNFGGLKAYVNLMYFGLFFFFFFFLGTCILVLCGNNRYIFLKLMHH